MLFSADAFAQVPSPPSDTLRLSLEKCIEIALDENPTVKVADMEITAFDVPHDGSDNMGFSIGFDSRRFVLATDLGEVQARARHYMEQADYLVIESNYDLDMLRFGRYPAHLKARIQTEIGHMDNVATGRVPQRNNHSTPEIRLPLPPFARQQHACQGFRRRARRSAKRGEACRHSRRNTARPAGRRPTLGVAALRLHPPLRFRPECRKYRLSVVIQ